MELSERIAELARPAALVAGLVVEDVSVKASGSTTRVMITVDLPADAEGSADLDAIASASRAIGAALDEANVPERAYVLEVSTPGIDRPLTARAHFSRARGRLVSVTLASGDKVSGRLERVDDDGIGLGTEAGPVSKSWEDVVRGAIEIEWKRVEG